MIKILNKQNCCGCSACASVCPKNCISMDTDDRGFLYPIVNIDNCVDCGVCEHVCPYYNQNTPREPLKVYAAINLNEEVRFKSSSGGVFTMLAEATIKSGGVVFGACFNDVWVVVHDYTESIDGIEAFRGSKYVQSKIGDSYKKVQYFLKANRNVLFSGTSCQIAGLKKYLHKEYDNLLTVEIVCHGVPSPLVWKEYLESLRQSISTQAGRNMALSSIKDRPVISGISFRDKTSGWKKYGFLIRLRTARKAVSNSALTSDNSENIIIRETKDSNYYMQVFLNDLDLRPSCYACFTKGGKSHSDITLADFWGIWNCCPEIDDDKGVSALLVNTTKGKTFINELGLMLKEMQYGDFLKGNPAYIESAQKTVYSNIFWILQRTYAKKGIRILILIKKCIGKLCRFLKR